MPFVLGSSFYSYYRIVHWTRSVWYNLEHLRRETQWSVALIGLALGLSVGSCLDCSLMWEDSGNHGSHHFTWWALDFVRVEEASKSWMHLLIIALDRGCDVTEIPPLVSPNSGLYSRIVSPMILPSFMLFCCQAIYVSNQHETNTCIFLLISNIDNTPFPQ